MFSTPLPSISSGFLISLHQFKQTSLSLFFLVSISSSLSSQPHSLTLSLSRYHSVSVGVSEADSLVTLRKVFHPSVKQPLASSVLLPCYFSLSNTSTSTSTSSQERGPRQASPPIRWTRIWAREGRAPVERTVLTVQEGEVRVHQAFTGRVSLPGLNGDFRNASLLMSKLRYNDTGEFRCLVIMGDQYQQDSVSLAVTGQWYVCVCVYVCMCTQVQSKDYVLCFVSFLG